MEGDNQGKLISAASQAMQRAADTIDSALSAHMQFMSGWMDRFEAAVDKLAAVEQNRLPEGWRIYD